jgi:hypothetical protein
MLVVTLQTRASEPGSTGGAATLLANWKVPSAQALECVRASLSQDARARDLDAEEPTLSEPPTADHASDRPH